MSRTPVMDERMRHRRQSVASAEARRQRRRLGSLAAVVALLVAAVLVARSPLLSVTEVRVEGVPPEQAAEVREASLLRTGDNLLTLDLGRATTRVAALPWVADAEARRSPPSVVTLHVTPRRPVAVAHTGETAWLLDAEGVVLAGGTRGDLPVFEVTEEQVAPLGESVTEEGVRNALAVLVSLPASMRDRVDRYETDSVQGMRLRVAQTEGERVWVRFGVAEDVEAKAEAIDLLLDELRRGDLSAPGGDAEDGSAEAPDEGVGRVDVDLDAVVLDVRAPNNPVVVPDADT